MMTKLDKKLLCVLARYMLASITGTRQWHFNGVRYDIFTLYCIMLRNLNCYCDQGKFLQDSEVSRTSSGIERWLFHDIIWKSNRFL